MASDATPMTYDLSLLKRSAERWRTSRGLRCYYHDLLREVMTGAPSEPRLELGSGIGTIREVDASVVTSDVAPTPYAERVVTAYAIEETGVAWGAIIAIDVLHHLCEPRRFLASAARSLKPGGRIVLAEPAATPLGRWLFRCFHHEPCRPAELRAPWQFDADPATGEFANMGMGWALFVRDRRELEPVLTELGLRIVAVTFRDGAAYLATGGFSKAQYLPTRVICGLLRLEQWMPQWFRRLWALRMIVVLEKNPPRSTQTDAA